MKTKHITALLLAVTMNLLAHSGVEKGPNGGRLLEFSKDETMHGEVVVKGDAFHIALFDKDLKPVPVAEQSLTAVTGDRSSPVKLEVTKDASGFRIPVIKSGEWLIVQFKPSSNAKSITARMHYETSTCEGCKKAEWLCACKPEDEKK